jgi:hypothetical protein
MGGGKTQRDENVIIPEMGAGKYWYVDPRAGAPQQPGQTGYTVNTEASKRSTELIDALQRLISEPKQDIPNEEMLRMWETQRQMLPRGTQPSF